MKNETFVLASVFAIAAVAGFLTKAVVDHDQLESLKNDLRVLKFKNRVMSNAFDAALDEVPGDRAPALTEKIETIVEFEKITSDQY